MYNDSFTPGPATQYAGLHKFAQHTPTTNVSWMRRASCLVRYYIARNALRLLKVAY